MNKNVIASLVIATTVVGSLVYARCSGGQGENTHSNQTSSLGTKKAVSKKQPLPGLKKPTTPIYWAPGITADRVSGKTYRRIGGCDTVPCVDITNALFAAGALGSGSQQPMIQIIKVRGGAEARDSNKKLIATTVKPK